MFEHANKTVLETLGGPPLTRSGPTLNSMLNQKWSRVDNFWIRVDHFWSSPGKKNLEWNSKAEPSAICQYVCLSFLFVQPISS